MYLKALCAMHHLKWKGVNPNNWVRVGAILCAMPPTPVAPFTGTYISFWYWHHFLMPKATRELQKRSRTATAVGQGKWLALVFLPSPVRDTQSSSECPQRGEKSRLAACDSLLPALSSGVSAAPHHRAEGPKLWALQFRFIDLALFVLTGCMSWFQPPAGSLDGDYLGTAQRTFHPKPIGFLCSPVRSCMSQCRQAHQPSFPVVYFSHHWHQTLLKCLAKGSAAFWGELLSTAQHPNLIPAVSPHCSAGIPLLFPLLHSHPWGCWQRCPQVLGMEKKERSTVLLQLPEGAAVAWVPETSMADTPQCHLLFCWHQHPVQGWPHWCVAQARSYSPWHPVLWPGHHSAWAMRFPWGTRMSPAKFCCWKKALELCLQMEGEGWNAKSLWQPVAWGHSNCDSSFHLFSLFFF